MHVLHLGSQVMIGIDVGLLTGVAPGSASPAMGVKELAAKTEMTI